jgi:hypothetical protein
MPIDPPFLPRPLRANLDSSGYGLIITAIAMPQHPPRYGIKKSDVLRNGNGYGDPSQRWEEKYLVLEPEILERRHGT